MTLTLKIDNGIIRSYRRLAYTPWHAMAEFVDNSTQSYAENRTALDQALQAAGEQFTVGIVYERSQEGGFLRVTDNAMGMGLEDLARALRVGYPPPNSSGRSEYGLGLKTAACWLGNDLTIRTKRLGDTKEYTVKIDVEAVASGRVELEPDPRDAPPEKHYTVIEVRAHHRGFQGRSLGKIKDFLRSMYRHDLTNGTMTLEWKGERLVWEGIDDELLAAPDGAVYKHDFSFQIDGKLVTGWVGILDRGSRAKAGFSIIRRGRVVKGWPDSWRPETLYGQYLGSNDLVNQRLVGEIHLDEFQVTHTKDDILWEGSQEDDLEEELEKHCAEFRERAKRRRKSEEDERGPSEAERDAALDDFQKELTSPEMVDRIQILDPPDPTVVEANKQRIVTAISGDEPQFSARLGDLLVKGYLSQLSSNDPYVTVEAPENVVQVVINIAHPHIGQLKGADGFLNYLRHCTYDAIAEWKAMKRSARLDPDTVKILKDGLLRVQLEIEHHGVGATASADAHPA